MGEDADPRTVTSDDANAWIARLRAHGRAPSTILSRIAARASLYDFVAKQWIEQKTPNYIQLKGSQAERFISAEGQLFLRFDGLSYQPGVPSVTVEGRKDHAGV